MRRSHLLIALAAAVLLAAAGGADAGTKFEKTLAKDVEGVEKNEQGQFFVMHEGNQWLVIDDDSSDRPFFFSQGAQKAQWEDPRSFNRDTASACPAQSQAS